MMRNAACALLRRSTAASASLSRATPPAQIVPHLLPPHSPALPARGFHAVAKSGQRRADTMLPARRHGHSAAKSSMENSSSIEEKKAALLQVLFKEEATAAAIKRNQQEIDKTSLTAEKEKLKEEMEALNVARKAKTEELLATIGRQGASGVDQETLMLARLAQAGQDMQGLKRSVENVQFGLFFLGVATGYIYISK